MPNYTNDKELQRQRALASVLRKNAGQQILPNWASGLASILNSGQANYMEHKTAGLEAQNDEIANRELAEALRIAQGGSRAPLQPGVMPEFQSPGAQGLAQSLAIQETKNRFAQKPSDVRSFEFLQGLSPEEQELWMQNKRAIQMVDQGDQTVGLNPLNPGGDPLFTLPENLSPSQELSYIEDKAEAGSRGSSGGLSLTPAQEAVDRGFGADYAERKLQGGMADVSKQLDQVQEVLTTLQGGSDSLTGPIVGRIPDFMRSFTEAGQEAINTRELIEEVVQRNLRLILGAQFTAQEGERLIARAYNPKLDESINAARTERLLNQMRIAAQQQEAADLYYEQNGTMQGYSGPIAQKSDFINMSFDDLGGPTEAEAPQQTQTSTGETREQRLARLRGQ